MSLKTVFIWLWIVLRFVATRRPFAINVSEIACFRYAEPMSQFGCHLETFNNQTVLSAFFILSQDVNDFQLKGSLDVSRSHGAAMKIFDFTANGCDTLNTVNTNNIVKSTIAFMKKSGHLPERCPIKANENYTLTRYALNADVLPLYTPECSYIVDMRAIYGSKIVARMVTKGSVEMKRKQKKF